MEAVLLSDRERGLLVRAAFKHMMRPPTRHDHIYLFSSAENGRRLMEAMEDARANRNLVEFEVDELRRELGLKPR
ncbi:MAG TPA: hypothetical protein VGC13_17490 [Longimicrobium sp.]|jgi:PHD/YefM family antitoxin component YafN of YafNO toxin-antitoxin module|uniref:hypothetical protein n=1 Tax=Longimicrobium sp. TaxID=2029185 RepID=UPI002ED9D749